MLISGTNLPAAGIADELNRTLTENASVVVTAPPGAGKSTLLPLTILDGLVDGGRILMLEPRRIAARQIAERMASMIGEPVGRTVGYRVRFESKVSSDSRIIVLTEGILTRMLVEDPTLEGTSVVIFDEFHERSLISDEALALARESQVLVRPDLRLVIMSATIDTSAICNSLGAKLIEAEGRMFPVETVHVPDETVTNMVRKAHRDSEGDILVFLPGEAEIRKCEEALAGALGDTKVFPLYGQLPPQEQQRAIAPSAAGERKVVLATPVAETSLTIEGVRTVIDTGLCRRMVFDPQKGLSHLETVRISLDMADQRTGRAGRVAAGRCYRLWSLAEESRMEACRKPEILDADLAPAVLDVAAWGESDISGLPWLTPPPQAKVAMAASLLRMLGGIDDNGNITSHGKAMASMPCHPRIAQMLLTAGNPAAEALAADIAALIEEKDPLQQEDDSDICTRISMLRSGQGGRAWSRIARISEQYRALVHARPDRSIPDSYEAGRLIAAAYPERVACSTGGGRFLLSGGEPAAVNHSDTLAAYDWIAVASLNSRPGSDGRIFLGAPVDPKDLGRLSRERDIVAWDSRKGGVSARHETRIGSLLVDSRPIGNIPRERIDDIICEAAAKEGRSMLDFSDEVENLQRRIAAVAAWHPELELPDLSTDSVLNSASDWLRMYLGNATTVQELKKIDLCKALWGILSYEQQNAVERIAPSHLEVPTGSRIRIEYRLGAEAPVLRVRLQECFGLTETPRVDSGRVPVLMELLSPGFKPVQLTSDLHSFWENTYFEVRKELRRRYPKHSWPDNPLEAEAVRGVKKRQ